MTKVEEYLRNAAECWKLANNSETEVQRHEFAIFATAWERLAEHRNCGIGNANPNDEGTKAESEVIDLFTGKPRSR